MKINKKFIPVLIILLILAFPLEACKFPNLNSSQKITAPKNNLIPIEGTWKITNCKSITSNKTKDKYFLGKLAQFNKSGALFADEVCMEPKYKIKVVNIKDYLLTNYKVDYKTLGITSKNAEIISITSKNKLFYDFIRINENKLLLYMDGSFFTLEKISNTTKDLTDIQTKENLKTKTQNYDSKLHSGVFIALRSDSHDIQNYPSTYRTIWLSAINKNLMKISESKGIYVPRKTGFWCLDVKRLENKDFVQDTITAFPVDNKGKKGSSSLNKNDKSNKTFDKNIYKNILFVGNDYLSTEYSKTNSLPYDLNKFEMLPIDNLKSKTGVKLSDLVGPIGPTVIKDSLNSFLSVRNDKKDEFQKQSLNEENFALMRKNGHWIMRGRLNSKIDLGSHINFDLNIFPPKKILNYDELCLSWGEIKSHVPSAIDAFTSPNNDIALIVCNDCIYIYSINNKVLSKKPLSKIPLKNNESIIMSEWATGEYVQKWKDSFENFIKTNK